MEIDSDMSDSQDLSLPRTMVQRLAKGVLPPNTSLGKDAIVAMQKGATVFINYLAQAYVLSCSLPLTYTPYPTLHPSLKTTS